MAQIPVMPHTGTYTTPLCLRLFHGKPETPYTFVGSVKWVMHCPVHVLQSVWDPVSTQSLLAAVIISEVAVQVEATAGYSRKEGG